MISDLGFLPKLPSGNGGISNLFRRIVLAYLLTKRNHFGDIRISQREIAAVFNRSGQSAIGKHLRLICSDGYLYRAQRSTGVLPDTYWFGFRLTETTDEYAYFTQLGEALFGEIGLLTTLGRLEALGVGCLNESGSLVLGTLTANCDEMSVGAITRYLNELLSERSVFRALSRLELQGIITKTRGSVRLSNCWEQKFERLLATADECCPRKRRGDIRRKLERKANLVRLRKGLLTDAERSYLRSQKCVYCDAKGLQQQHFPPKKFIDDFTVINNRHFIWPICAHCNDKEKNFIRSMPSIPEIELISATFSDTQNSDLLLLYRIESERGIMKFHEAHMAADSGEASTEILRCMVLWMSLDALGLTDESDRYDPRDGYIRYENTLRVPLRLRIREACQTAPGSVPWLHVVLRLDGEIREFSYADTARGRANYHESAYLTSVKYPITCIP